VRGDEQEAHVRNQQAELLVSAAVVWMHHQTAQLGRAVVREADAQHLVMKMQIGGARVLLLRAHVHVDVRRVASPELRHDHRSADRLAALEIANQKYVFAAARVVDLSEEALLGSLEQPRNVPGLVGQVDGVQVASQPEELALVSRHCPSDLVARLPRRQCSCSSR
jgi:hypothetical protein